MANIIDTLIVELALDPTKFTQAQQQAVNAARQMTTQLLAHAKEIESAGAKISHFFESAKRELLAVTGIVLGGKTVAEFVAMDAAMTRSARTIGISTEQLAKWGVMARATGGDLNTVTSSLQGLSDRIAQAQITGDWGNLLQIFSRFGINLKQTKDGLVDIDDVMDQLNATFSKMDPVTARALLSMLGLDKSTIDLLIQQRSEFVRNREAAEEMGHGLADAAAKAEDFYKSVQLARGEADLWLARIVGEWSPQLKAIVDKVREWLHLTSPSPSSPEGERIVQENELKLHRLFGPSPLDTPADIAVRQPMGLLPPSAGQRAPRGTSELVPLPRTETSEPPPLPGSSESYPRRRTRAAIPPSPGDYASNPQEALAVYRREHGLPPLPAPSSEGASTSNTTTTTTTVGTVNVNISGAGDPEETGREVYRWFLRFSHGASTYNGPH